jgi:DNA polymerase-1
LFWYWNSGLDALHAELVGISFSYEKGKDFTLSGESGWSKSTEKIYAFFENEKIEKIGQNLKYDLKILSNYGINVEGKYWHHDCSLSN